MKQRRERAITLVALVVTIIVLLILAAVSINLTLGENGIITNAVKSAFYSEMSTIDEQKNISKLSNATIEGNGENIEDNFFDGNVTAEDINKFSNTLKAEIIYVRTNFGNGERFDTRKIWKENFFECRDIFANEDYVNGMTQDLKYISKEVGKKEKKYIYDSVTDVCFKVPDTKIGSIIVHSIEYARFMLDGNDSSVGIVDDESGIAQASDGTKYYEPNLNNFSYKTEIMYFSLDLKQKYYMNIKEYLAKGKSNIITQDDITYKFADYIDKSSGKTMFWANVRCSANGLTSYWTWIPRYAYRLNQETQQSDIIFIDLDDKPMDTEKYGETLPNDYIVHDSFKQKDGLKGIWFSKYQPSAVETVPIDNEEAQTPDLRKFVAKDTKLIYYTSSGLNSDCIEVDYSENPEQIIERNGKQYYFYDYDNKIWANVKCNANNLESYWVWIPRYAYKLESGTSNIILIDENDKPINKQAYGDFLPSGYIVHDAFKQKDGLKGIWFSKYQPSVKEITPADNKEPQTPDLSKFVAEDTKLIYYTLSGANSDSIEVDYSENPQQMIERNGKQYYFYNYENRIWANIRCKANNLESNWVWIPRYAYKLESGVSSVIFVDENDKPLNKEIYGEFLPNGYIVHDAFKQKAGLKGLWFSKYQPTKIDIAQ